MTQPYPHEKIEKNVALLIVGILLAISVGGLVQIVPLWYMKSTTVPVEGLLPYSALDLTGRDIGESIHISQIALPEGSRPVIRDRDFTVATIVGRKVEAQGVVLLAELHGERQAHVAQADDSDGGHE